MQTPAKCSIFLLLLLLTKWVCANEEVTLFLPLLPRASLVASVIGGVRIHTLLSPNILPSAANRSLFHAGFHRGDLRDRMLASAWSVLCDPTKSYSN